MTYSSRLEFATSLAWGMSSLVEKTPSLGSQVPFLGLHGSLAAGEGTGDNYDIDFEIWLDTKDGEELAVVQAICAAAAREPGSELDFLDDARVEFLNGTGGLIGVRAHLYQGLRNERIGVHAVRLSDVLGFESAFREIASQPLSDVLDDRRFSQLEAFVRNYVVEAIPVRDVAGIHRTFKDLVQTYPRNIQRFRMERVGPVANAMSSEQATEDLLAVAYAVLQKYRGNPKRIRQDLCDAGFGFLAKRTTDQFQALQELAVSNAPARKLAMPTRVGRRHWLSARCAVTSPEGLLMVREALEGVLETPGGSVLREETPQAGAAREAIEECGVVVAVGRPACLTSRIESRGLVVSCIFECDIVKGTPTPGDGITECRWVPARELSSLYQTGQIDWHDKEYVAQLLDRSNYHD